MGLIIDSSLFIGEERKKFNLAAFFAAHSQETPYMAAITAAELLHGVERATPEHRAIRSIRVEQYIASVEVIDFDLAIARRYASIWAAMEASGDKPDAHDLLIATTALHFGFAVATTNIRHFAHIPGIRLLDTKPYLLK
ncbi:MAG: PIN domain-containing protein [Opitutae bacterium]